MWFMYSTKIIFVYSFNSVINRSSLKSILSEKYLEVFTWFETELEDVQKVYEEEKVLVITSGSIKHINKDIKLMIILSDLHKNNNIDDNYNDDNLILMIITIM